MDLLRELLQLTNFRIVERLTSPHVLSRADITVILNAIHKNFGLSYDTNNNIGLCLLSQVIFSIAATADISEDDLGGFVSSVSRSTKSDTFNDLGKLIKWFNKTPIKIQDKHFQLTLSAHPITNAAGLLAELKLGQPVVCAIPTGGVLDEIIDELSSQDPPDWARENYSYYHRYDDDYNHGDYIASVVKDFKDGFVSKQLWEAALRSKSGGKAYVYHSSLCIGYEDGDKAFLFREPRPSYARNGYYKVAAELMTPENIGLDKPLIHGMFYVEVVGMKEVSKIDHETVGDKR